MKLLPTSTVRNQWLALLVLVLACTATGQANAQVCGSNITLNANQWRMVGIPCNPGANNTIGAVFGPSMNAANYGVTWIAWKRLYDAPGTCTVASGPADCYTKLTLASTVSAGDAFWIYTTQQVVLNFSSIVSGTPGSSFEIPAQLSSDSNSRYYMLANPYASTVSWANVRFPAVFFGIFSVNLTSQQAVNNSIVSKNVHYWNGNTYFTRDLNSPVATFKPKEASWLEMLNPSAFFSNVRIQILKP